MSKVKELKEQLQQAMRRERALARSLREMDPNGPDTQTVLDQLSEVDRKIMDLEHRICDLEENGWYERQESEAVLHQQYRREV